MHSRSMSKVDLGNCPYVTRAIAEAPVGLVVAWTGSRTNAMTVSFFSEVAHHPTSMWLSRRESPIQLHNSESASNGHRRSLWHRIRMAGGQMQGARLVRQSRVLVLTRRDCLDRLSAGP
jgi:hypothetical protein